MTNEEKETMVSEEEQGHVTVWIESDLFQMTSFIKQATKGPSVVVLRTITTSISTY